MRRPSRIVLVAALVVLAVAAVAVGVWFGAKPGQNPPADRGQSRGAGQEAGAPPPAAGGYFAQLPAGAALPTEQECAARVHASAWEPRPENYDANHTRPQHVALGEARDFDTRWNAEDRTRVTGGYVGTTDEIIQWAACKWGLSDELLRAQATQESEWDQAAEGDMEPRSEGNCVDGDTRDPCPTSFGLLQNKWYFNTVAYPSLRTMTPFHMDWSAAKLRGCLDGHKIGFPAGDMPGCLGNWFSGGWHDATGEAYLGRVRRHLADKEWLGWPDRSDEVPYTPYRQ